MPGLEPGIQTHDFFGVWMAGSIPAMTLEALYEAHKDASCPASSRASRLTTLVFGWPGQSPG
jgi:hypothetical protein